MFRPLRRGKSLVRYSVLHNVLIQARASPRQGASIAYIMHAIMIDASLQPAPLSPTDRDWQEVEDALEGIARLAKSDLPPTEFHREMLNRLVQAIAAIGGAIWIPDQAGGLQPDHQIGVDQLLQVGGDAGQQQHGRLLASVLQGREVALVPPNSGNASIGNPTSCPLILCPVSLEGDAWGIVEVFHRPESRPDLQRAYVRIVTAACELVGDYHRDRRLQELCSQQAVWRQWRQFADSVHGSLDLEATAYAISNEGRRLIDCDRLSVVVRRGTHCRLLATSGVDAFHKRANSVRRLESLAKQVLAFQEPLWYPAAGSELPPQLATLVEAYVDESHVRSLAVVPLQGHAGDEADLPPQGALIVEQFDARRDVGLRERVQAVCAPAAVALRNSLEHEGTPLLRWLRRGEKCLRLEHLPKTLVVAAALAALLATLTLVPAEFAITARGELQPQRRYHVFAPQEGVVTTLAKSEGDSVRRGDTLVVLTSSKLALALAEVVGKRRTTEEQLAAIRSARMQNETPGPARDRYELSAQEAQLKEKLEGLEQQFQILSEQRRQLTVGSPIDGQILTFDLERLLAARPVQSGDKLLTVADIDGPWELELRIDDDQAGHVLAAQREGGSQLPVAFILATDPGVQYAGQVRNVAAATEIDNAGRPTMFAQVDLAVPCPPAPRPGATVIARIHCGRRSIGYVWLRPLLEAIQSWLFF